MRTATFMRRHPYLTQLDGQTVLEMQQQQLDMMKEQEKWLMIQKYAMENDINPIELKSIMTQTEPRQWERSKQITRQPEDWLYETPEAQRGSLAYSDSVTRFNIGSPAGISASSSG